MILDTLHYMALKMTNIRHYSESDLFWIIGQKAKVELFKINDDPNSISPITRSPQDFSITHLVNIPLERIEPNADVFIELRHVSGAALLYTGDGYEMYEAPTSGG